MKKNILILILLLLGMYLRKDSNQPLAIPSPVATSTVESYVREHIGNLAPEKEQLGGTFFVTKIETNDGIGTVEYEDGHNGYTADFTHAIDQSGIVTINSFVLRK